MSSKDGDISDAKTFDRFLKQNIGHVFHCASNTFVPESWNDPAAFLKTNVQGTVSVLEFCRKKKVSMTYVSAYVYGSAVINPIKEDSVIAPNNPYALSKRMAEELCEFYYTYYGLQVNIVRPFNIYGPGQHERFLVPYIINQALHSDAIRVKDLFPKRDFIYIDDVVDCLIKAMKYKTFGIFNAGSGKSFSVRHVIDIVKQITGRDVPVISENLVRPNEISDTIADISLAERELDWVPVTSLEEGLKRIIAG